MGVKKFTLNSTGNIENPSQTPNRFLTTTRRRDTFYLFKGCNYYL